MSCENSEHPRILLADECCVSMRYLGRLLRRSGFDHVVCARNGSQAIDELSTNNIDLAIIDVHQSSTDSMGVLRATRRLGLETAVVILAERGSIKQAVEAMREGAQDYISKPINPQDFLASISSLLVRNFRCANTLGFKIDTFLRQNAATTDLRLGDLCLEFTISPSYMVRIFREHLGTTFKRRLNFYRVERAKQLLEATDRPIYLIAMECGFRNHRRLAEVFKKALEMSPTIYRRQCRNKDSERKFAAGKAAS